MPGWCVACWKFPMLPAHKATVHLPPVLSGMLRVLHTYQNAVNLPLTLRAAAQQGLDISQAMLEVAGERGLDGDTCLSDLGQGLPMRGGCFDGAISISAVQWLCNADTATADPLKRLRRFFDSLCVSVLCTAF